MTDDRDDRNDRDGRDEISLLSQSSHYHIFIPLLSSCHHCDSTKRVFEFGGGNEAKVMVMEVAKSRG